MAKIYNAEVTNGLAKNAGIQINVDKVPNELAEKIVPTFETNPDAIRKSNRVTSGSLTNATSANIITTEADRDTYLVGVIMHYIKDATATSTEFAVQVTPENQSIQNILRVGGITLTADSGSVSISLPYPLKLKRNATQLLYSATNVGNFTVKCSLIYYVVESAA